MTLPLQVEHLTAGYVRGHPVLTDITFDLPDGELLAVIGPNGAGKSTLLRCLLGWIHPDTGVVRLRGCELRALSHRQRALEIAYVPQFPPRTVGFSAGDVVLVGRYARMGWLGLPGPQDIRIALAAMEMTETADLFERPFDALSGGEMQRVAIARALAQQPGVMLLDEPTSHLDLRHQLRIGAMLQRVAHEWPMAIVWVLHDLNLAARFADRILVLHRGRGVALGTPADVLTPTLIEQVYGVETEVLTTGDGRLHVVVRQLGCTASQVQEGTKTSRPPGLTNS